MTELSTQYTKAEENLKRRQPGSWLGLIVLMLVQVLVAIPVFAIAYALGGNHWQQAWLAGAVVWPLVALSYVPMLVPTKSDSVLVQMYLAIMIRMFGTLGVLIVVRQIAAPLAPNTWFAYIFAFYLAGLIAESAIVVSRLNRGQPTATSRVGSG